MSRPRFRLLAAGAALAAPLAAPLHARAGEAPCWFERGAVVVSAEVAGVVGDFILDTGAPRTVLAETQAQAAGYEATEISGEVALAGVRTAPLPMVVQDIDVRTGLFATPIAGIIGADALKPYVLDLRAGPCRIGLHLPLIPAKAGTHAASPSRRLTGPTRRLDPRLLGEERRKLVLPLTWIAGVPTVEASASDGSRALTAPFVLAAGSDTAVRLSDAYAAAPGAAKPQELYPYGVLRPRLRALSFAGQIAEGVPAGLVKSPDPAVAGEIGAPVLMAFRLRFDFPAGRLELAPNEKGPGSRRGP